MLVIDKAEAGDEDLLKAAAAFQAREEFQALFRNRFEFMLAQFRHGLTVGRKTKSPKGSLIAQFSDNPRLQSALAAGELNPHIAEIIEFANNYWHHRDELITAQQPNVAQMQVDPTPVEQAEPLPEEEGYSLDAQLEFRSDTNGLSK